MHTTRRIEMQYANAFVTDGGSPIGDVYDLPEATFLFGTLAEGEIAKLKSESHPYQITDVRQGWYVRTSWDYVEHPFQVYRATGLTLEKREDSWYVVKPDTTTKDERRMDVDARSFILGVGKDELIDRGVVRGQPQWIVQESTEPLLQLMKDRGVDRMVSDQWFLTAKGEFSNPNSETQIFNGMNNQINPFFRE